MATRPRFRISEPAAARWRLHSIHAIVLMDAFFLAFNIAVRQWTPVAINAASLTIVLLVWLTVFHGALWVRVREIETQIVSGLWCDACALPSGVELSGTEMSKQGIRQLPTMRKCTRCNRPLGDTDNA